MNGSRSGLIPECLFAASLESDARRSFEVPVILVLDGRPAKFTAPDEIRTHREPMGSVSDLHGIPRDHLIPLSKPESLGESSGFFFELEDFARRIVDENPPGPRGIIRAVAI